MFLLEYLGLRDFIYGADLRFTLAGSGLTVHHGSYRVTNQSKGCKGVVGDPAMTKTMMWRVKIHCVSGNMAWMMVGVNSRPQSDDSYDADSTYGWAARIQVFKPKL